MTSKETKRGVWGQGSFSLRKCIDTTPECLDARRFLFYAYDVTESK